MRRCICGAVLTFAFLLGGAVQAADPFSDAKLAYERHDFAAAAALFHEAAAQGNPAAMSFLGFMYHDGEGVPTDLVRSCMWFMVSRSLDDLGSKDFRDASDALELVEKELGPAGVAAANAMAHKCQANNYRQCD